MENKERTTSELLQLIVIQNRSEKMSVGDIKNSLRERGFGILLALAVLPICLPVPVPPGYTTFFSIPLFIFSVQMMWGVKSPWLPGWINKKEISKRSLERLIEKVTPWLRKIESYLHARITYISVHAWERIIGIFAFIFTIPIALPIPLINVLPSWGILIMSLGLLNKDGLTIIVGMTVGTIGIGIALIILALIWMGVSVPSFY
ncbi:exopolysaccharide biosynthesis protein [Nitrosomonas sp. Nm34]|uniref:exopolysaccharide biosynthesis protein n=1 Tax=Nitrosomonas sp. Nm34 TaxID=1881055 RepID=UPI0008E4E8B9|nr:exopolysaccharide biosynthesis protein [Nitrosomonas sp. Nm34]SFI21172.1 Uncharacterized conserved protein [Nitrosomonas sp. Nm34]